MGQYITMVLGTIVLGESPARCWAGLPTPNGDDPREVRGWEQPCRDVQIRRDVCCFDRLGVSPRYMALALKDGVRCRGGGARVPAVVSIE
jgi:hypothetical protein